MSSATSCERDFLAPEATRGGRPVGEHGLAPTDPPADTPGPSAETAVRRRPFVRVPVRNRYAFFTRSHHKCDDDRLRRQQACRMDKITRLEFLARFLGGLVEFHGREHAAHVLCALAEGVRAGVVRQHCDF